MAISQNHVKSAVVLSMAGTATVIVVANASKGRAPQPRMLIAVGFIYVVIAGMADVTPELALPMAVMVFVGVTLAVGGEALAGVQKAVKKQGSLAVPVSYSPPATPAGFPVTIPRPKSPVPPGAPFLGSIVPLPRKYAAYGGTEYVDQSILQTVESICDKFGVSVTDGYSTDSVHVEHSDHKCGMAVDFVGPWQNMDSLGRWAYAQGFPWVGWQVPGHFTHVHISFRRCNWNRKEA